MFFQVAHAAEASQKANLMSFLPIVAIFAIFYFLIIRPQSKKAKEEQLMRNSLQIGNKIITTSGMFGTVSEIDDKKSIVSVTIAKDVTVVMYKSSIASVLKEKDETKENA